MLLNHCNAGLFLFIFLISIFFSCKNGGDQSGSIVYHPIKERIPYHKSRYIKVSDRSNFEELENKSANLVFLKKYLQDPSNFHSRKLNLEVGSHSNLMGVSFKNRLIILDGEQQHLIEYDLKKDSTTTLAEFGRGPGDIAHAQDLIKDDESIYIGMQDMRVSEFDCSTSPCSYSKTFKLDGVSPYSIDINDSIFVALGSIPVTGSANSKDGKLTYKPVFNFNQDGEKINSFGKTYKTDGHWMLLRPFTEGKIRYNKFLNNYLLAYHRLPYLYVYNSDFNLSDIYFFSDFILGKQKYWPEIGKLNIVMEDYSLLRNISFFNESLALIEVETKSNMSKTATAFTWDHQTVFYVIDINDKKGYYLGKIDYTEESSLQALFITNHGLLVYNSGSLYWTKFQS